MKVSIKDVAKMAGVSTATVSHVINDTRYVSESTKHAVLAAMKRMNYLPNSVARSLRSQKSKTVGLIVPVMLPDTSSLFFYNVSHGIQQKLKESGYNLILSNSTEHLEDEIEQIRMFKSQLIDGLIVAPTLNDHSYLNDILGDDCPVIFIDRKPIGYSGDCVLVDGFKATYEAIELLISRGHKKIGYIGGHLGLTTSDERFYGYIRALSDNGISVDNSIVKHSDFGSASFQTGYDLMSEFAKISGFSSIFIANNVMTMGAIAFLQEQNIKIPEELAVIGYDDYDWTKITNPPLTVIKQPSYELGIKAAEVLLDRIRQPQIESCEYRLDAQLIIRKSI